ncbi:MAG: hypothetical protein A3K19_30130 [Lentisphaerae bacterium RIFOXYB12_FULL_65_16]|nr:MAG: hypothetical protein A3K18_18875 [Lentisphaerae bacterium RIFOXYA12_64_32]OGV85758.1 MAG: hypothetical protein A3K19_30130 [Lentisphaerae bacterium RIFOXYB12_FULL_65_16]
MTDSSILIVEDEAIVAADLAATLRQLGYSVAGSTDSGEKAIALARQLRPALVLMDIRLAGGMDGLEAAATIRRETDLPIIYLTAHSDSATVKRAMLSEPFGYILKPFEERELRVQIEMAFNRHAADRLLRARDEQLREANTALVQRAAELQAANEALLASRRAALNLVEDAVAARRQAEQALVALRESREDLKRAQTALQRMNAELEERVVQRTAEAREAARYARSLIEASLDPIFTADRNGTITDVNHATELATGRSRKQLIGSGFFDCFTDPDGAAVSHRTALTQTQSRDCPLTIRHRSGRPTEVLCNATVYRDERGQVQGVLATARDITERKALEQQVLNIRDQEQRRIGQDLHDVLCQQIAAIGFLCEALRTDLAGKKLAEAEKAAKIGRLSEDAGNQARYLARGLFPVGADSRGLMSALKELARQTTEVFRIPCQFKRHRPVLVPNNVTATHLYRIAQEAVSNAVKHSAARRISIVLTEKLGRIELAVRDNGCGFSRRLAKGKSIGISSMQYRANMIGGSLALRTRKGRGTVVACSLPKSDPKRPVARRISDNGRKPILLPANEEHRS